MSLTKSQRKVCFIEPGARPGRMMNAWIRQWPLLGPIVLASLLKQKGYEVTVYNENILGSVLQEPYLSQIAACDVVCLTIMTPTACRGYEIADHLRRLNDRVVIAIGGAHATFMPQEALEHAHVVCRGEGEGVIEAIARGDVTAGVVDGPVVEDLDAVPRPDFALVAGFDGMLQGLHGRRYELPMATSRGCPYGCTYCSVTRMFGRKVRRQSVDRILSDARYYAGQGFSHLMFYDDNFTADRDFTRGLLNRLAGLGLRFNAQVRADFMWKGADRRELDKPLLEAMQSAGGDVMYVGYETIDDQTARRWHKGYGEGGSLRDRLAQDTRIFHDHGLWVHGMFVLGPEHGDRDARNIVDFARATRIESLQVSVLTPLPGTPTYDQMKPHLVLNRYPEDWDYYDGTHCVYNHGRLGIEGLTRALLTLHRRFYGWRGASLRRMLVSLRQEGTLRENLKMMYRHFQIGRQTLKAWHEETQGFIQLVRDRLARRAPQLGG